MSEHDEAPLPCRRCGLPVAAPPTRYRAFDGMHWVCYHYTYEHTGVDVDDACADTGCPSSVVQHEDAYDPDRDGLSAEIEKALVDGEVPLLRLSRDHGPGFLGVRTAGGDYLVVVARLRRRR